MSRLCSIRENEKEIDRFLTETLQRQKSKISAAQKEEQSETVLIQVANGAFCNGESWDCVTSGSRKMAPFPASLQMQNRFSSLVSCIEDKTLVDRHCSGPSLNYTSASGGSSGW